MLPLLVRNTDIEEFQHLLMGIQTRVLSLTYFCLNIRKNPIPVPRYWYRGFTYIQTATAELNHNTIQQHHHHRHRRGETCSPAKIVQGRAPFSRSKKGQAENPRNYAGAITGRREPRSLFRKL